jgi:pantetheine-phosphate adenylyltransferase
MSNLLTSNDRRVAVYTGSFDPVTLGHLNVIQRASKLFDELIIGVGTNVEKQYLFSTEERVELLEQVVNDIPNVRVKPFEGLAVNFVKECGSDIMVRGMRPLTDIAGEFTMLMANRQLDGSVETVFLMSDENYSHVSSTLIKQIVALSNDEMLAKFVPAEIIRPLRSKLAAHA